MGWAKYFEDDFEIMSERRQKMTQESLQIAEKTNEYEVRIITIPCVIHKAIGGSNSKNDCAGKDYEDKYIICKDCGKKFLFSAQEKERFDKKGWVEPKRCKKCRDVRNTRRLMCSSF